MKRCLDCNAAMPADPKGIATAQTPTTCAVCRGAPSSVVKVERQAVEDEITRLTVRDGAVESNAALGLAPTEEVEDAEKVAKAAVRAEERHAAAHRD